VSIAGAAGCGEVVTVDVVAGEHAASVSDATKIAGAKRTEVLLDVTCQDE
jgi:hypothetical protein